MFRVQVCLDNSDRSRVAKVSEFKRIPGYWDAIQLTSRVPSPEGRLSYSGYRVIKVRVIKTYLYQECLFSVVARNTPVREKHCFVHCVAKIRCQPFRNLNRESISELITFSVKYFDPKIRMNGNEKCVFIWGKPSDMSAIACGALIPIAGVNQMATETRRTCLSNS